jgi:hypothetical protein
MQVHHAKQIARQWAATNATVLPGFAGAYLAGSIVTMPEDAELAPSSDVDLHIVLEDANPPIKPGKFIHEGVLLEVSLIPHDILRSPEEVLGNIHLSGCFRYPGVLLDPTGELTHLHEIVQRDFAKREYVIRRCDTVTASIRNGLESLSFDRPFPDYRSINGWLFPTGITTFILLAAGLRNPTVRKRYAAVREVLAEYDMLGDYESLLALLGCAGWTSQQVEQHLGALEPAFADASTQQRTPYAFASDISDAARPIVFEGTRELIAAGLHRETVFWLVATWCRCLHILEVDAPESMTRHLPAFRALLSDLGITSEATLRDHCHGTIAALPHIRAVAGRIIARNLGITS